MKYYAVIGQTGCTVDETQIPRIPRGCIAMLSAPPAPEYIAKADGTWELPKLTGEEIAARELAEIDALLNRIDLLSIRPLRSILNGADTAFDMDRLAELENEAVKLRGRRNELTEELAAALAEAEAVYEKA